MLERTLSYAATTKLTKIDRQLQKQAVRSDLSEDEKKRVLAGLGYVGIAGASARFTEANGADIVTTPISIIVPQGTLRAFTSLGIWDFSFGPRTQYVQRPLSHMLISWEITGFTGRQLDVDVHALLRDENGDGPWEADIEIIAACFA